MSKHRVYQWVLRLLLAGGLLAAALPSALPQATSAPPPAATRAPAAPTAAKTTAEDDRVFIEHADEFRYDPDKETYYMRGQVVMRHKKMRLQCDEAEYNEANDTARATGSLRIIDPEAVITGDLIEADFDKELAVITGNVRVVTQKKPAQKVQASGTTDTMPADKSPAKRSVAPPDGSNPKSTAAQPPTADKTTVHREPRTFEEYRQKQTTITCERLEYEYNEQVKRMVATPRVKAVQEGRTLWADRAEFDDIKRIVTLIGKVLIQNDKGDEMNCSKAVAHMDDDWLQAENMSGITLRQKKEPATPAPATENRQPPPAAAPAAGTTPPVKPADSPAAEAPTTAAEPPGGSGEVRENQ